MAPEFLKIFCIQSVAFFCVSAVLSLVAKGAQAGPTTAKDAPQPGVAESQDVANQLGALQRSKDPKTSYQSDFQTRFYAARTQKIRQSKGSVVYRPPSQFRWEIASPEVELYVSSGKVLWKHSPKTKHASRMAASDAGLDFLQALTDPAALVQRYSVERWNKSSEAVGSAKSALDFDTLPTPTPKGSASSGVLFVKLVPKAAGTPEDYLYLIADQSSGQVDEIRIAFRNGNRNIITFAKWSASDAGPKVFEFTPPAGTAVDNL